MNERIRMVRAESKLSRAAFGEKLGVSGDVINNLERGRVQAKESIIKLICSVYSVNEKWLRTGEGDMFVKRSETDELAAAVERLITGESADFKRRFISALSTLKDEHWLLLEAKLKEIVGARDNAERPESMSPSDIDAEAESYRAELKLQAEVEEESSASDGPNGIGETKMA